MRDKQKVITILTNACLSANKKFKESCREQLVETNKMSGEDLIGIFSGVVEVSSLSDYTIVLLYQILEECMEVPRSSELFTREEIEESRQYTVPNMEKSSFPLKFTVLAKLSSKHEYLLALPIQKIAEVNATIMRLDANRQRSKAWQDTTAHARFNMVRAIEIGEKIGSDDYWSNALRWNLLVDGNEDFSVTSEGVLTINKGYLMVIDGRYRSAGIDYALDRFPSIDRKMPVILTIATMPEAQEIMKQESSCEPIATQPPKAKPNIALDLVVKALIKKGSINSRYKFIPNYDSFRRRRGFVIESFFAKAIQKNYFPDGEEIKDEQVSGTEKWLTQFLVELAYILRADFSEWKTVKSWSVNPYAIYGYILLSKELRGDSKWLSHLKTILKEIDFTARPWRRSVKTDETKEKCVETIFAEAVKKVVG